MSICQLPLVLYLLGNIPQSLNNFKCLLFHQADFVAVENVVVRGKIWNCSIQNGLGQMEPKCLRGQHRGRPGRGHQGQGGQPEGQAQLAAM